MFAISILIKLIQTVCSSNDVVFTMLEDVGRKARKRTIPYFICTFKVFAEKKSRADVVFQLRLKMWQESQEIFMSELPTHSFEHFWDLLRVNYHVPTKRGFWRPAYPRWTPFLLYLSSHAVRLGVQCTKVDSVVCQGKKCITHILLEGQNVQTHVKVLSNFRAWNDEQRLLLPLQFFGDAEKNGGFLYTGAHSRSLIVIQLIVLSQRRLRALGNPWWTSSKMSVMSCHNSQDFFETKPQQKTCPVRQPQRLVLEVELGSPDARAFAKEIDFWNVLERHLPRCHRFTHVQYKSI